MDGTGPQQPLSDSQLDRELESALGVEPSPEFLARVRTRVAAEPGPAPWRLAIRRWSFEPLAGVALAGIVFAVVVPNLVRSAKKPEPAVTVARHVDRPIRDAVEELPPVAPARVMAPAARQVVTREPDAVHTVPLQLSQPLFSEDERRALVQLIAGVEAGRLPPVVSETATAATSQPDVRSALHIEPLVIDPLPLLARVQKEGESQW
jgi:hypothetical protein